MHGTEARGVIYDYCKLSGIDIRHSHDNRRRKTALAYIHKRGALVLDEGPVTIKEIPAEGRSFTCYDQAELQGRVAGMLGFTGGVDAFIEQNLENQEFREFNNAQLMLSAEPFTHPRIKIIEAVNSMRG
jgi:hypothetical protein